MNRKQLSRRANEKKWAGGNNQREDNQIGTCEHIKVRRKIG
jgi:hypothetical protein